MCRRRYIKEIKGRVFLDTNNDGIMNNSELPLKDIGIKLFAADDDEITGTKDAEILIRREKFFSSTKTDETGEFRFLVSDRAYTVCLDMETLPADKSANGTDRFCGMGEDGKFDFAIKDIKPVSVSGSPARMSSARKSGVPAAIKAPEASSTDRIRLARSLGVIDEHREIEYLLQALFSRRNLPEGYRSEIPIKSGTVFVEDIKRYMERADADPELVEAARQKLAASVPELDKVYKSPNGYFNIHYTLSGDNAVAARTGDSRAVPPYIEQIGKAFDNVKTFTCRLRGFREPLTVEGRNIYDVYVFDQKGKYGVTYSSNTYDKRNTGVRVATSFICIDNTYSGKKGFDKGREDCMKVTAAHEFFHAVQYAYNVDSDNWWKEASATWNEDEVYTGVNDYLRYVPAYLSAPFKPLDESSYSGVVFAKFLAENYGGTKIIKKIWEIHSKGCNNSINAIDRAVSEGYPGRDIGTVFNQFSAYNVNPAQYYKEGELWKTSATIQKTYSSYPVALNYGQLNHMSSNYLMFKPSGSAAGKSIRIKVDGTSGARWGFKLQNKKRKDKMYSMTEIVSSGAFSRAVITMKNFGELYEDVCFIPSNLEKSRDGLKYSYTVEVVQEKT